MRRTWAEEEEWQEEGVNWVSPDSVCSRCKGLGHFARDCGTPASGVSHTASKSKAKGKGGNNKGQGKGQQRERARGNSKACVGIATKGGTEATNAPALRPRTLLRKRVVM